MTITIQGEVIEKVGLKQIRLSTRATNRRWQQRKNTQGEFEALHKHLES